jgi:hypothetical protein
MEMIQISDEVFDNYGQPNSVYLRYHGFVLEENPSNCVDLSLPSSGRKLHQLRSLQRQVQRAAFEAILS